VLVYDSKGQPADTPKSVYADFLCHLFLLF